MRFAIWLCAGALILNAASKTTGSGLARNDSTEVSATVHLAKEDIKAMLGSDLGGDYVVMEITVTPRLDKIKIDYDNFILRTDRDGERSKPFTPHQIAGRGALVVTQNGTARQGGMMGGEPNGPVWGGAPGTGGMPQRLPGSGGGIGNAADVGETKATMKSGATDKENPLVRTLAAKILPVKESEQAVTGLLYFQLAPKQKVKDLEMIYTSPGGTLRVRFK